MNELKVFEYHSNKVRTVERDGEPWFVLKDVCQVLGIADHKVVARRLDTDEVCQTPLTDSVGRNQETLIINESGLYSVILRSDKPEAKPFRKWVTSEVLPSIRKTGAYHADQEPLTGYQQIKLHLEQEQIAFQKANLFYKMSQEYEGSYRQVLNAYAAREMAGEFVLPLPRLEEQTYTAGEIGEMLGISGNKVGVLTNRHNLKTEEYGAWFADKAKGHNKEVQSFRYYEKVVPVLRAILDQTADKSKKT